MTRREALVAELIQPVTGNRETLRQQTASGVEDALAKIGIVDPKTTDGYVNSAVMLRFVDRIEETVQRMWLESNLSDNDLEELLNLFKTRLGQDWLKLRREILTEISAIDKELARLIGLHFTQMFSMRFGEVLATTISKLRPDLQDGQVADLVMDIIKSASFLGRHPKPPEILNKTEAVVTQTLGDLSRTPAAPNSGDTQPTTHQPGEYVWPANLKEKSG
jgi:hypothetical protein